MGEYKGIWRTGAWKTIHRGKEKLANLDLKTTRANWVKWTKRSKIKLNRANQGQTDPNGSSRATQRQSGPYKGKWGYAKTKRSGATQKQVELIRPKRGHTRQTWTNRDKCSEQVIWVKRSRQGTK